MVGFVSSFVLILDSLAVDLTAYGDINVVTGVLKLYFRELPDPVFPFAYFDTILSIAGKFLKVILTSRYGKSRWKVDGA
jgi:hypothetical protein